MADVGTFEPRATYDGAAAGYATLSEELWPAAAERLVDLADPQRGERVLDVACGPGTLTMRLAAWVGKTGSVHALDLSPRMVAIAALRTAEQGLSQVTLGVGDMHRLPFDDESVDVVTCGLGLFFAHDVTAVAAELWRVLRPGGRLAVSTVGAEFFSPLYAVFVEAVLQERPGEDVTVPWARTERPEVLEQLLAAAGISAEVTSDRWPIRVRGVDDWWRIVMGTGIRRLATPLTDAQEIRVLDTCARHMKIHRVDQLTFEVVFAAARKHG